MGWTSGLTDMAMSPEEKADYGPMVQDDNKPEYPYGLRICLCDSELEKLDLDMCCNVGDMIDLRCRAKVTSVSQNQRSDGTNCCRIELQITEMAAEGDDE
jgi:hypothetical protein